jgi:hypothetical protein
VSTEERFPCCKHCDHSDSVTDHFYPCDWAGRLAVQERATEEERIEADRSRIRAELRDRIDRCDDFAIEAALRQLAHDLPDEVNEALDTTGAPS